MIKSTTIGIVLVVAICTFITRSVPFLLFGTKKEVPDTIEYLGKVLPAAIMGALIIYCLKNVSVLSFSYGIPEGIAVLAVVILHLWKINTLLSIAGGTIIYMVIVQNI